MILKYHNRATMYMSASEKNRHSMKIFFSKYIATQHMYRKWQQSPLKISTRFILASINEQLQYVST
jgi:hypothetical protein